jgi:hypothetical protein
VNKRKLLEQQYKQADETAMQIVEEIARKILRKHKKLDEFCMGMGTWFFSDYAGKLYDGDDKLAKELDDFMNEWDAYLHLTGQPMRFTADGPVITDW